MIFKIEDVTVYFPYENIYPEQYEYMVELKRALDAKGHCLLEMPTRTGKTITLLSLITSYRLCRPDSPPIKLLYCTRTVHEMEKTLDELKLLYDYQLRHLGDQAKILAIGLSSGKNLCLNPKVLAAENRDSVDAACRKRTASWVRESAAKNPNVELCDYFEKYEKAAENALLPPGVYTLEDLMAFGKNRGWCPYFLARRMFQFANVIVCSYQYLLDPKVAGIISKEFQKESVVVFDEGHNIDNMCIDALSVSMRKVTLEGGACWLLFDLLREEKTTAEIATHSFFQMACSQEVFHTEIGKKLSISPLLTVAAKKRYLSVLLLLLIASPTMRS